MDPRGWDLNQMLAAYEAAIRRGAKDENEFRRAMAELSAEPRESLKARTAAAAQAASQGRPRPSRGSMSGDEAEALIARMAAADAQFT